MSSVEYEFVMGEKKNWRFLYVLSEKQFYTLNATGAKGKIYRCHDRKCKCRVLLKDNNEVIRWNDATHSHENDCEDRYKTLKAMQAIKDQCASLSTVASGKRMMKTRDIFKQAIIE